MQLARIEGHPTLVRDLSNKHIVQTDLTVVRKHEARSASIAAQQKRDSEIAELKRDVAEIKTMLDRLSSMIKDMPTQPVYQNPNGWPIGSVSWGGGVSTPLVGGGTYMTGSLGATGNVGNSCDVGSTVRYG